MKAKDRSTARMNRHEPRVPVIPLYDIICPSEGHFGQALNHLHKATGWMARITSESRWDAAPLCSDERSI